jgi:NAD+ synthase (glutamine-hydrolysing)
MLRIRVAACQINTVVGDLSGNVDRMLEALAEAEANGADLAVFPELTVTGYPPEDLLGRPAFVADNLAAFAAMVAGTGECAAVVGFVDVGPEGRLVNAAALCRGGDVLGRYVKRMLPNYGVFDEQRWFAPGSPPATLFDVAGVPVGMTICEDMWIPGGPMAEQAAAGARLLVNLNASPYSRGRREERLAVLADRTAETDCAVVYVNQVGASAHQFVEEVLICDLELAADPGATHSPRVTVSFSTRAPDGKATHQVAEVLEPVAEVYEALVLGTRDYLAKNGFSDAVIGLSGGIDSSLVAAVAVDAVGSDHVHGVAMPSRYSSEGSLSDADALAANFGIDLASAPIEAAHRALADTIAPLLGGGPEGLTDENLQSRIRGVLLMALSNSLGWIVLTTGNKSEMATGYSTLYGDSAGGFAVIKDVSKTLVYELCRYRNARAGSDVIPEAVLTKAPSAELRPDQRDDESLPPYEILDPVMAGYVEGDRSADDLVGEGFDPAAVARVVGLVDRAEYKRRQMPPGVRISGKAFGKDRRMPITNHYRSVAAVVPPADGASTIV